MEIYEAGKRTFCTVYKTKQQSHKVWNQIYVYTCT